MGALSRAAGPRISVRPEHRPDRRALAHAHQDRRSADSGGHVAARVAGDESSRCAAAESQAARPRLMRFRPQPRGRRGAKGHRDRRAGPGIHAFPLCGSEFQPRHAERLRSDLARAELQAVRRERTSKPNHLEQDDGRTSSSRQRYGGNRLPRTDPQARTEIRGHGLRRRDARQLQPHPALVRAGRRAVDRRDHAEFAGMVPAERDHPPAGRADHGRRSGQAIVRGDDGRCSSTTSCCWRPAAARSFRRSSDLDKENVFTFRNLDDTRAHAGSGRKPACRPS